MPLNKFSFSCPALVAMAVILLLGVHLAVLNDYGQSWDEPYAVTRGVISSDLMRSFLSGTAETANDDDTDLNHPAVYATANHLLALALQRCGVDQIRAYHVLNVLMFGIGVLALFLFVRRQWDETTAIFSAVLLALYPRAVAHCHYNPKDIPIMACGIVCFWLLARLRDRASIGRAAALGAAIGFSFGTKLDAGLIVVIGLFALLPELYARRDQLRTASFWGKLGRYGGAVTASGLLLLYATWPLLWRDPFFIFTAVGHFKASFWDFEVLYFGTLYPAKELPWHYVLWMLVMATPVPILLLFGLGAGQLRDGRKAENWFRTTLVVAWLLLPILIRLRTGVLRYDGMRHVFLAVPAMTIIAAIGLRWLSFKLQSKFKLEPIRASWAVAIPLILYLLIESIRIHPNQGNYVNEVARIAWPERMEEQFEIEYYGASYQAGVEWLNQHAPPNAKVCVPIAAHLMPSYQWRSDLSIGCQADSQYLMFITRKSRYPKPAGQINRLLTNQDPIFTVRAYGATLMYIFALQPHP